MSLTRRSALSLSLAALAGCEKAPPRQSTPIVAREAYGQLPDNSKVELFTLVNSNSVEVKITNYGGIVTQLRVPDRKGTPQDIALGFDSLEFYLKPEYRANCPYFGALIGRYGNRIAKGKFKLGGKEYTLATNNGPNHLHGGIKGFDKVLWQPRIVESPNSSILELTYVSKDGEEGYPGNLTAKVTYTLTAQNELKIDYSATTDNETVVNLTNHTYFNLRGAGEGDALSTELTINADHYTPVDAGLIPTGKIAPVKDTPFDFTKPKTIGQNIYDETNEQIKIGGGYDHNFVLNKGGGKLVKAAEAYEPRTGRVLEVFTTEPGVQFYTGNFLDGKLFGKGDKQYNKRSAFCLETQHFPDSPNRPEFPSTTLKPGERYQSQTVWKFSAR